MKSSTVIKTKRSTELFELLKHSLCLFQVRDLGATKVLVKLFNSDDPEVRRYSTGAIRNMIYQHGENKKDLIDNNGIKALDEALEMEDDELRKNITGKIMKTMIIIRTKKIGSTPTESLIT